MQQQCMAMGRIQFLFMGLGLLGFDPILYQISARLSFFENIIQPFINNSVIDHKLTMRLIATANLLSDGSN